MAIALFASEQYLKAYTPIGGLVEFSEIEPSLHLAQDSWIQDILGSNFYVYLQEQYRDQQLNPDETILVSLIKPALAFRVAATMLPFLHMQMKNKGVLTQSGDYSQPIDLDALKYLRNELQNGAEFYSVRLSRFLCENRSLFPEYTTDNEYDMRPHSGNYDMCDLYLGDGGCC